MQEALARFLPAMLLGLSKSTRRDNGRRKVIEWIKAKRHLGQIVWYLRFVEDLEYQILESIFHIALEDDNEEVLLAVLDVAATRREACPEGTLHTVFMPTVSRFVKKGDTGWIDSVYYAEVHTSFLSKLQLDHAEILLSGLIPTPRIEHRSEKIFSGLAEAWPEKVLDFFEERLRFAETANAGASYEAIPFSFDYLSEPLSKTSNYLIRKIRALWEDEQSMLFYKTGRLLAVIFPGYPDEIDRELRSIAGSGKMGDVKFVVHALTQYEDEPALHDLLRDIVSTVPPDDPLLQEVEVILELTGGVMGEFGFVEAYKRKRGEIHSWLSDPRDNVRAFAERRLRSLDRQIAVEQRRSEERLELRKRNYGWQDSEDGE